MQLKYQIVNTIAWSVTYNMSIRDQPNTKCYHMS